jgi:hypothetical protein
MSHPVSEHAKDYPVIDVDLPDPLALFLFKELCRRDMRPSELVKEMVEEYLDKNPVPAGEVALPPKKRKKRKGEGSVPS